MELDYSVSSGPFLSSELIVGPGPGPGPKLDNLISHCIDRVPASSTVPEQPRAENVVFCAKKMLKG